MSFYLARLEAAREQHRMMMAAAAAAAAAGHAAHTPRAWPPYHQQHAALLPLPQHRPPVPPPLHAAGCSRVVDTWRAGAGIVARRDDGGAPSRAGGGSCGVGSVARRDDGAPLSAGGSLGFGSVARRDDDGAPSSAGGSLAVGVAGSATGATTREETGGGELRNKRLLAPTTPRPRSPPPAKRRAVGAAAAARRLFPPGCGRDDAALPLASADDGGASRPVAARGVGGGAPHKSAPPPPPPPRPALASAKVGSVVFEATPSPRAAAAAAGSSALQKVSASDGAAGVTTTDGGGHHCQGERLVNSSEAAAAAGPGNGKLFKSKDGFVPSVRLLPKPATVSAHRLFPPGCRRLGAPLAAGDGTTSQVVCLPSPEEVVPAERYDKEFVVRPGIDIADGAAQNEGSQDGTIPEVHESQVSSSIVNQQRIGNRGHSEEMSSSALPASGANVINKPDRSSCNIVAAESLAQGLSKEGQRSESVSQCGALNNTCSDDLAATTAMSGEGAVMRKKVMHTPRKSVGPPKLIQKPLPNTQRRPFPMAIERETEIGWSVNMNDTEDTGVFTKDRAVQDPPISANKSPWTNGKEADFFGPKKRVSKKKLHKRRFAVKGCARPTLKIASKCALGSIETLEDDDEVFKALAAHETNFEHGPHTADARSKVKLICNRFESICRAIVQAAGHRSMKVRRIDLAADKLIRKLPGFTKQGPVVGSVPGVEVGDEFLYRVQLALVGLHRPFQGGIDSTRHESSVRIAISVVASGGYPDELSSSSGELVYTGSGKKGNGDQKLEHGNLALKNCIGMKTPVRVIHGFKDQNREEGSHSRAKEISTFTYDGLYHVVDCWREGSPGSKVFKYRLQRIPGQPQLSLHRAKAPW